MPQDGRHQLRNQRCLHDGREAADTHERPGADIQRRIAEAAGEDVVRSCRMCGGTFLDPAGVAGGYSFVTCADCGFVFAPAIGQTAMAAAYAAGYHGPVDGAPEDGWANAEFLAPAFARLPDRPLAILDFGTGQSFVPDLLRSDGHRVIATDVVPPVRPHPDRLTGRHATMRLSTGAFDLVFAFQVFEHLPEPRAAFEELLRLARPGGLVLIHTDMETPERTDTLGDWWYVSPPDHCSFFRHRTFARALDGTPSEICWTDAKTVIVRKR